MYGKCSSCGKESELEEYKSKNFCKMCVLDARFKDRMNSRTENSESRETCNGEENLYLYDEYVDSDEQTSKKEKEIDENNFNIGLAVAMIVFTSIVYMFVAFINIQNIIGIALDYILKFVLIISVSSLIICMIKSYYLFDGNVINFLFRPHIARKFFLLLLFNCSVLLFYSYGHGVKTIWEYLTVCHDLFEIFTINLVGFIYICYLLDSGKELGIIKKIIATIIYGWAFQNFNTNGSFIYMIVSGFAAIIPTFFAICLLGFIVGGGLFETIGAWADLSKLSRKEDEIKSLENDKLRINNDSDISYDKKSRIIQEIDRELDYKKEELSYIEKEIQEKIDREKLSKNDN